MRRSGRMAVVGVIAVGVGIAFFLFLRGPAADGRIDGPGVVRGAPSNAPRLRARAPATAPAEAPQEVATDVAGGHREAGSPWVIRGRVRDENRRAVANAAVSVYDDAMIAAIEEDDPFADAPEPTARARTNAAGEFSITCPASAPRTIVVRAAGCGIATRYGLNGDEARPIAIILAPTTTVPAIALDSAGLPIAGAEVAIMHAVPGVADARSPLRERVVTRGDGTFEFEKGRGPGSTTVLGRRSAAETPAIFEHERASFDVLGRKVFTFEDRYPLSILLVPADGDVRVDRVRIDLFDDEHRFALSAVTDGLGRAVIASFPARESVRAISRTPGVFVSRVASLDHAAFARGRAPLLALPHEHARSLEIPVDRGVAVSGVVVDRATNAGVAGIVVLAGRIDPLHRSFETLERATTAEGGEFAFAGLPEESLALTIATSPWTLANPDPTGATSAGKKPAFAAPMTESVEPIQVRADDPSTVTIRPTAGVPLRGVRLDVARSGRVRGRVVDESLSPVAGVRVMVTLENGAAVLSDGMQGRGPASSVTDAEGRFSLEPVPAMTAFHLVVTGPGVVAARTDVMRLLAGESMSDFEIRTRRALEVGVIAHDLEGLPVGGLVLQARAVSGKDVAGVGVARSTETDDLGNGRLRSLAPEPAEVWITPSDAPYRLVGGSSSLSFDPRTTPTLEIVVSPAPMIDARFLDPAGRPLSGATVRIRAVAEGRAPDRTTSAVTDADGAIHVRAPAEGALLARVSAPLPGDGERRAEAGPLGDLRRVRFAPREISLTAGTPLVLTLERLGPGIDPDVFDRADPANRARFLAAYPDDVIR